MHANTSLKNNIDSLFCNFNFIHREPTTGFFEDTHAHADREKERKRDSETEGQRDREKRRHRDTETQKHRDTDARGF